jgi:ribosomal protein S18 acetylase RimI-like enzyme
VGPLTVTIEPLSRDEARTSAAELIRMNAESDWDDWDENALLAERPEKWLLSLVARDGAQLVGWAVSSRRGVAVHLHHLVVAPDHRNHGVGRLLLDRLVEDHGEHSDITLKVHHDNAAAMRFYERAGFRRAGSTASGYVEFVRPRPRP